MLIKCRLQKILAICVIFVLAFLCVSCGNNNDLNESDQGGTQTASLEQIEKEMVMPEDLGKTTDLQAFATIDIYNNPVDNSIFSDYQYTIIDVWGTYCNPCIKAMPEMKKVYDLYKDRGVNVVGIVIDLQNADRTVIPENVLNARKIVEKQDADFTHILVPNNLLYSFLKDVQAIPTQFLVDSEGNIVSDYYKGGKTLEQWCDILDKKLK